ncbi:C-20 methyltransferase BchU [Oscillochloris trichoides DG-6]|uniref:C-20 methyltransferase BchU n=1 Tax=Oscillochloris trichoides DG-6 TaxID=765420 RepID=E1ICM6_9CHLR|nr:C-20 methyltransferase BchU [Oscillochloris trichoides]EFO81046.1 C-20 methyltransferase BchU [Oscillochloris trichoides DG-6]
MSNLTVQDLPAVTTTPCTPGCRCSANEDELFAGSERAYDIVFKGTIDFFAVKAATDLGLFEAMGDGVHELNALAEATGTVPMRLEKFLITLKEIGIARLVEGKWALTPFAVQFFTDPEHHRNLTMVPFVDYISSLVQTFYVNLADVVRGKMDFTSLVPYPPRNREDNVFYETIHRSNVHFPIRLLREHAKMEGITRLLDVGGGIGDISSALCEAFPELNVTLINLDSAVELVSENVASRGLAERITPLALDMYKQPYPQTQAVMFARILYPMNEQFSTMMLKKAFDAIEPGGRIFILDMVISDQNKPNYDYLTHYICSIGMGFSVLDFKDHELYTKILEGIGFTDVTMHAAYDHVLYQAVKP